MGLSLLGNHHITHSFAAQADGSAEISFSDDTNNDFFTISVYMSLISYHIDLQKSHSLYSYAKSENGTVQGHKIQSFAITVGDLFKLYYKNSSSFFEYHYAKKGKKREKNGDEQEETKTEYDRQRDENQNHMAKLTVKAMKASTNLAPHHRNILGCMLYWNSGVVRLWNLVAKEGKVTNHRSDFVNFCSMLVVLPIFNYEPNLLFEDALQSIPYHDIIRKLTRYYLFAEDPEVNSFSFGYTPATPGPYFVLSEVQANLNAGRDYFEQPKSILEICEAYTDDFYETSIAYLKDRLASPLNQREQNEVETKYNKDLIFDKISTVEEVYPVYALRTIYLESWSKKEDYDSLFDLVATATALAKSEKCKLMIQKRYISYSSSVGSTVLLEKRFHLRTKKENLLNGPWLRPNFGLPVKIAIWPLRQ
eukprot:Phypoly_transcript_07241.p1 GENE.Phypoly_transcript_07241~~Phypoly_transcript_07241.p1  ORF type:complete len:421 (+),score=56.97 Phypoly_transcript_07241:84-1346(+)